MTFSNRTNWDTHPTKLAALLHEKQQRGEEIIDLTESNPTRCGFQYNAQSMLDALATRRSLLYEPNPNGLLLARTAIADWYSQHGVSINPEHLFLTASTSEGYSFLLRLLFNAGDAVLMPKPSYPLLDYLCQLNDVVPQYYSLKYDGEWHIDFERLEKNVTEKTRAIILVHPNNPTGSFIKHDERSRIEELARRHNLPLIVDEVFGSFGFE
ncbi:MAG: pyridoxal phosphate-dependent aminotransferase, partial [Ignavibacteriales bacterium]|nr:pyridoxal phosphate-dependent aminotransferase [Ignavibacteriales bacterium]